jgi:hypothetical protein
MPGMVCGLCAAQGSNAPINPIPSNASNFEFSCIAAPLLFIWLPAFDRFGGIKGWHESQRYIEEKTRRHR